METSGNIMMILAQAMSVTTTEQLVPIIDSALMSPGIYHFGELIDIAKPICSSASNYMPIKKLELFAYGCYGDWAKNRSFELNLQQQIKLKQLTLVSLASSIHGKQLCYSTMQEALEIRDVRELEDLVLKSIYDGVVKGKLDQKRKVLSVEMTIGRDVHPSQMVKIAQVLTFWEARSNLLLRASEENAAIATQTAELNQKRREEFEQTLKTVKETAKSMLAFEENEMMGQMGMPGMTMMMGSNDMMTEMDSAMNVGPRGMSDDRKKRRVRSKRDAYGSKDRS